MTDRKHHESGRGTLRLKVAAALMTAWMGGGDALAQASSVHLEIASQPLDRALASWASQTGYQLLVMDARPGPWAIAPAIAGEHTPESALQVLLAGSGMEYRVVNARTIAVMSAQPQYSDQGKDAGPTLKQLALATNSTAPAVQQRQAPVDDPVVEEVIVTAQKRSERLIDTPQSVSTFSADQLAEQGALQFRDFADTVAGMSFQSGGAGMTQISMRGVTTGYDITPSVGILVDDVPYGSSSAFARGAQLALDVGLFDVNRVEILRGPQGTLYGASTMGGLVKYVLKQPDTTDFGVQLSSGVASSRNGDLGYNAAAAVNVPLAANKAALRVSGFYTRDGGYIDNVALGREDVNESEISGGRVDFRLTPSEQLEIRLGATFQDVSRNGTATADYDLSGHPVYRELGQYRLIAEPFDQDFSLISGTVNYSFDAATLTSVSSYQTSEANFVIDASPGLVPVMQLFFDRSYSAIAIDNDVTTDKFTQELRLASKESDTVEWLFGGFYTHESSRNIQEMMLLDSAQRHAPNDVFFYDTPSKYEETAAFANVTYHFTEKFNVSGGLRYARNEQTYTQIGRGLLIGSAPRRTQSENVTTYLANARYHFTNNSTGYVRFATGYRPGGPNAVSNDPVTGLPQAPVTFEADTLKSYEAGFKAQSPTGAYGFDIGVYYIDWEDLQELTTTPSGVSYYANAAAGATIRGTELTLSARPVSAFTISGAFAYQDAQMNAADPALGARKGERLPNVPRFTATLSADYIIDSIALQPRIGATFRSVSARNSSFDNNTTVVQYRLPSYETIDLRAGVVIGSVEAQIYVRNILDEYGQLTAPSGISALSGPVAVSILQPRTFGLTATARF